MKHQHHFDPNDVALREMVQISALISDLDRCSRLLDSEIVTEEERAGVSDPFNGAYPVLTRSLTARRENLKRTIAALEERLASRPDDVEMIRLMRLANSA
jgi:hypothetical protein